MKIKTLLVSAIAASLMLTSCNTLSGTSGQSSSSSSSSQGLLESLITGMLGNVVPLSATSLEGTWNYSSPEVRFESESALAQAGGAVAANKIESQLSETYSKVGIKPGSCSITFNSDNTCVLNLGGRSISGTYTVNSDTRELNIVSNTGLIKLSGKCYVSVGSIAILFDANKLLSLMKTVGTLTGGASSTISALSTLLDNYNGALLGMNLKK